MRALIYDPYLDTAGGGERYMLTAANVLSKNGYKVDVYWPDPKIAQWLEPRLGIDFSNISFVETLSHGAGYNVVFWLSDGSLPLLLGGKNIIHFQTPFTNVNGSSLFNRLKKTKIDNFVCNSNFTRNVIDKEFKVDAKVVYPPVDTSFFVPGKKENVILFVGRYSQLQQLKRQDILIDSFKKMYKKGLRGWRLVLVGGSEVGGREYVQFLKSESKGYPIDILENLPLEDVKKAYARAKIFWSASGFGVNEETHPFQVEHFGMSVVEAMAAGAVPVAVNKGGHKETINPGEDGFLWDTTDELQAVTLDLIKDEGRRKEIAEKGQGTSQKFSVEEFEKNILEVFKG